MLGFFLCRVYAPNGSRTRRQVILFTCSLLLQVDGTCWVAFFAVCMLQMAPELVDKLSCLPVPCFYRLMVRAGLLSLQCVCTKLL